VRELCVRNDELAVMNNELGVRHLKRSKLIKNSPDVNCEKRSLNHVLIVDDDETSCFISQKLFELYFHISELKIVRNGRKAIDYLIEHSTGYPDIIILDINMPIMNGFEFLDYYHHHGMHGTSKIAMYTSSKLCNDRDRALLYPDVIAYLEKPLTVEKLNTLIVS